MDREGTIRIPGFYDRVRPLSAAEREQLATLRTELDDATIARRLGVHRFRGGRPASEYFERFASGPVLNLDGLQGGYQGPYIKTMLPDRAAAKVDIRLVPDMDKEDVKRRLRAHLDAQGFGHVDLHYNGAYNWSKTDLQAGVVQAAIAATRAHGLDVAIWPMTYYCAPTVVFNEPPLNLPVTDAGIGYMGSFHAANEYFAVESMRAYEKWLVRFFDELARR
jgi:acetylornithine deacetylase/succinyl-diaminopimelate desuccinylase-like protein